MPDWKLYILFEFQIFCLLIVTYPFYNALPSS